jgi:hypothetical protein
MKIRIDDLEKFEDENNLKPVERFKRSTGGRVGDGEAKKKKKRERPRPADKRRD